MANHRVRLIISGQRAGHPKDIPALALADEIRALVVALEANDRSLARGRQTLEWVVVAASHSSPMAVEMEARPLKDDLPQPDDHIASRVEQFFDHVDALEAGRPLPPNVPRRLIESYHYMAQIAAKSGVHAIVRNERRSVVLGAEMESRVQTLLAPAVKAAGSIEGRLEWINVHDARHMYVYPWVGASRIKCVLTNEQHVKAAGDNLARWVRVHGILTYPAHSVHPTEIEVQDIEPLPSKEDVPTLRSLRGIAPDATQGETSDAFQRRLRDAW